MLDAPDKTPCQPYPPHFGHSGEAHGVHFLQQIDQQPCASARVEMILDPEALIRQSEVGLNKKKIIVVAAICAAAVYLFLTFVLHFPSKSPASIEQGISSAQTPAPAVERNEVTQSPLDKSEPASVRPSSDEIPLTAQSQRRPFRREPEPVDASSNISELLKEADRGNSRAAYRLSMKLYDCSILYGRYERLQEAVRTGKKTEEAGNKQLTSLDEKHESCKGLSKDDFDKRFEYIAQAAEAGDINAQVDFLALYGESLEQPEHALDPEWIRAYKEKGVSYLKAAVSKGSVDAMSALAMVYWDGLVVEKNVVIAYAYMYAVSRSGLAPSAQSALRMWEPSLSPEEVSKAKDLGTSIYKNCCE
jgi:hypothetical protein